MQVGTIAYENEGARATQTLNNVVQRNLVIRMGVSEDLRAHVADAVAGAGLRIVQT